MKRTTIILVLLGAWALGLVSCAEHRETRTQLYNENIYLNKDFLTRANPHHVNATTAERDDYGWLLGVMVTAVSVPTPVPDIFPGYQSDTRYIRFSFTKDTMQMVDAILPGPYGDEENIGDPREAQDLAPRVVQEYEGTHVDLQLQRNLDGEVTNLVEEYRERDWEDRQFFKVDLEEGVFRDLSRVSWYYDWATAPGLSIVSTSLVPDSFHYVDTVRRESNMGGDYQVDWERGDYMEWTVRITFHIDMLYAAYYYSLLNWAAMTDSQTVDIKYSLWRRPDPPAGDEYVPRPIAEKDVYRRQFGIWDYIIQHYQDPDTGLVGATLMLSRFNPNLDIHYYMVDVPQEFRNHPEYGDIYDSIAEHTNNMFEQAGVDARIHFHEQYEGGFRREPGDIRYSFVWWHNNAFSDIPWLGYGPSWMDPRTGEIFNATLNFNNWQGLHWYTYVAADLLAEVSDAFDEESPQSCTPGQIRPVVDEIARNELMGTSLYRRMVSYMGQEPDEWIPEHSEEWHDYYHMLLRDIRFFYPPYNTFVYTDRESTVAAMQEQRQNLLEGDREFWEVASRLDSISSPTGFDDFTSEGAIEAALDFIHRSRDGMTAHANLQRDRQLAAGIRGIDLVEGPMIVPSIANINQRCTADGTWQTFEEWEDDIRWLITHQVSIHELGHDLGLYHNFYASADRPHYQPCTGCIGQQYGFSSSVMDYGHHFVEPAADLGWYPYDIAALTYAYRYDSQEEVSQETDPDVIRIVHPHWYDPEIDPPGGTTGPEGDIHLERAYLYANDYHYFLSPMVEYFDLGTTPSEVVFNQIQYYDWMYQFRNFRSYRQYWETWGYPSSVFDSIFWLRRFLELWTLDWSSADIKNDLRLLGVEGDAFFFENIADEFQREMGQANRLAINFYRSILTQSNAERSYATTYDTFFGDVTRLGIIYDKYYAMLTFLGFWPADWYNWDVYAYWAYYELNFGDSQCYSDAMAAVDEMLGGAYDVYPWFLPLAVLVFAEDTHNITFGDQSKKEWIGFRSFDRTADLVDYFGFDPRYECLTSGGIVDDCTSAALGAENDGHQTFYDADGGQWIYLWLDDRNLHLTSSADISPISFQLLWDYNESVNIDNLDYVSTYDIKYYLDYYQYFN
ncbi:MAG: zinc-dependent metalloprotease [Bradymonadales bacterium]|nr:zinc-dependent metalloprotease [Bradymonadales bacterium]